MAGNRCKYYKQKKQVSYDNGMTWQDVIPYEYQKGALYEQESADCGYVPPTGYKLSGVEYNGNSFVVDCDEDDILDYADTKQYNILSAAVGSCVDVIFKGFYKSDITGVVISDSVEWLGGDSNAGQAFTDCTALTSVIMSNNIKGIGCTSQFANCTSLPIYDGVRYADTFLVGTIDNRLETYNIKEGTLYLNSGAFANHKNLTSITIPNGVKLLGWWVFSNCENLTKVILPNSLKKLGGIKVFKGCTSLTSVGPAGSGASVELPSNLNSISEGTFWGCSGLTSVTIGDSVEWISCGVFWDCTSLISVEIGSGLKGIGYDSKSTACYPYGAFGHCESLESVTIHATTPPLLVGGTFDLTSCLIYVPAQSVNAYRTAPVWSSYARRILPIQ